MYSYTMQPGPDTNNQHCTASIYPLSICAVTGQGVFLPKDTTTHICEVRKRRRGGGKTVPPSESQQRRTVGAPNALAEACGAAIAPLVICRQRRRKVVTRKWSRQKDCERKGGGEEARGRKDTCERRVLCYAMLVVVGRYQRYGVW